MMKSPVPPLLSSISTKPTRHRWILGGYLLGLLAAGAATAVAVAPTSRPPIPRLVIEQLELEASKVLPTGSLGYLLEEKIEPGDTLGSLMNRLGVTDSSALTYVRSAPETSAIGKQLAPGKRVAATTSAAGELLRLHFPLNERGQALVVERNDGELTTKTTTENFDRNILIKRGVIRSSLFAATDALDIPDAITLQLVEILSGDIDFHRDLRKGDRFVVTYEMDYLRGQAAHSGKVLGVEFTNNGKTYRAIWFDGANGGGYYTDEGKPLKREFLRSPLEFSRVTSSFSQRFHPILKQWHVHTGVDYGAPTGTKVRATADATVKFAGTQRGYGNIVILQHSSTHTTAYAHLQRFAKGIRKGSKVSQGDTIGYVGSTGWATGPHLHYEFRINGTPTNPLNTRIATGTPLRPDQLEQFYKATSSTREQIELLSQFDSPATSN